MTKGITRGVKRKGTVGVNSVSTVAAKEVTVRCPNCQKTYQTRELAYKIGCKNCGYRLSTRNCRSN